MTKTAMPEPAVVVMPDFNLCFLGSGPIAPIIKRNNITIGTMLITTDQAEAYAAAKVREALEAAATIADAEAENARKQRYYPGVVGMLTECATDIRALIPRHDNE